MSSARDLDAYIEPLRTAILIDLDPKDLDDDYVHSYMALLEDQGHDCRDASCQTCRYYERLEAEWESRKQQKFEASIKSVPTDGYFEKKKDDGKLDWSLLPFDALRPIVAVLDRAVRSGKYARDSWKSVPDAIPRYKAALLRHWEALERGELIDPESHLAHSAHIATNALFLLWFDMKNFVEEADEPPQ